MYIYVHVYIYMYIYIHEYEYTRAVHTQQVPLHSGAMQRWTDGRPPFLFTHNMFLFTDARPLFLSHRVNPRFRSRRACSTTSSG